MEVDEQNSSTSKGKEAKERVRKTEGRWKRVKQAKERRDGN